MSNVDNTTSRLRYLPLYDKSGPPPYSRIHPSLRPSSPNVAQLRKDIIRASTSSSSIASPRTDVTKHDVTKHDVTWNGVIKNDVTVGHQNEMVYPSSPCSFEIEVRTAGGVQGRVVDGGLRGYPPVGQQRNTVVHNSENAPSCAEASATHIHRSISPSKCAACCLDILDVRLEACGRLYHAACFRCTQCNCCLHEQQFTVDISHNVYCLPDYNNLFAPRCAVCGCAISDTTPRDDSARVVTENDSYHIRCFLKRNFRSDSAGHSQRRGSLDAKQQHFDSTSSPVHDSDSAGAGTASSLMHRVQHWLVPIQGPMQFRAVSRAVVCETYIDDGGAQQQRLIEQKMLRRQQQVMQRLQIQQQQQVQQQQRAQQQQQIQMQQHVSQQNQQSKQHLIHPQRQQPGLPQTQPFLPQSRQPQKQQQQKIPQNHTDNPLFNRRTKTSPSLLSLQEQPESFTASHHLFSHHASHSNTQTNTNSVQSIKDSRLTGLRKILPLEIDLDDVFGSSRDDLVSPQHSEGTPSIDESQISADFTTSGEEESVSLRSYSVSDPGYDVTKHLSTASYSSIDSGLSSFKGSQATGDTPMVSPGYDCQQTPTGTLTRANVHNHSLTLNDALLTAFDSRLTPLSALKTSGMTSEITSGIMQKQRNERLDDVVTSSDENVEVVTSSDISVTCALDVLEGGEGVPNIRHLKDSDVVSHSVCDDGLNEVLSAHCLDRTLKRDVNNAEDNISPKKCIESEYERLGYRITFL